MRIALRLAVLCALVALGTLTSACSNQVSKASPTKLDAPQQTNIVVPVSASVATAAPVPLVSPSTEVGEVRKYEVLWKHVGADPCKPNKGCTAARGLALMEQHAGWPHAVTPLLLHEIATGKPTRIMIEAGWVGGMTWGAGPKFAARTLAAFPGQEPAERWSVRYEDRQYNAFRVGKCGNWGFDISEAPGVPAPRIPPAFCP